MDALADRSMRFTRCFNQSPVCSPARHSINTGQYAHRHGVLGNFLDPYEGMVTLAHAMAPAGYRCFHRGHMHWRGRQDNGYEPSAPGSSWVDYDDRHSTMPKWALDRYYQENAFHIRRQTGGPSSRKPEHYTGHYVTENTIASMRQAVSGGRSSWPLQPIPSRIRPSTPLLNTTEDSIFRRSTCPPPHQRELPCIRCLSRGSANGST